MLIVLLAIVNCFILELYSKLIYLQNDNALPERKPPKLPQTHCFHSMRLLMMGYFAFALVLSTSINH